MSICRRLQTDPYLLLFTKLKFKQIKGLNTSPITLNLTEEKVRYSQECMGTGDHFLHTTPVAQTLRSTINKWDLLKMKIFCKVKEKVIKTKWQAIEWGKNLTNPTSVRGKSQI